jgi:hypothetical protein
MVATDTVIDAADAQPSALDSSGAVVITDGAALPAQRPAPPSGDDAAGVVAEDSWNRLVLFVGLAVLIAVMVWSPAIAVAFLGMAAGVLLLRPPRRDQPPQGCQPTRRNSRQAT